MKRICKFMSVTLALFLLTGCFLLFPTRTLAADSVLGSAILSINVDNIDSDPSTFGIRIVDENGLERWVVASELNPVTIPDLPIGTYTVVAESMDYNCTDISPSTFSITDENFQTPIPFHITFHLLTNALILDVQDPASGEMLNGAEIKLSTANGADFESHVIATKIIEFGGPNNFGYGFFDLPAGMYYLKQTKAPEGYVIDDPSIRKATVRDREQNWGAMFFCSSLTSTTGYILFEKLDEQGNRLSNSTFNVWDSDGNMIYTMTTDQYSGADMMTNIPFGDYTIKEITPPEGYPLDPTIWHATFSTGHNLFKAQARVGQELSITAPPDITKEATANLTPVDLGAALANVSDIKNNAPASSLYPVGVTEITWTATDSTGETATAVQKVTIKDSTPPALVLPDNISVWATSQIGSVVSFAPTATDLVDGSVKVTLTPASGSKFKLGTTTVKCSATDSHGNKSTGCFIVSVRYNFKGFFAPIKADGAINEAKAGKIIPIKFSLGGYMGMSVFAKGYPEVKRVNGFKSSSVVRIDPIDCENKSCLQYDMSTGQYIYLLKTDKSWANTTRKFIIKFKDGTVAPEVYFKFR